MRKARQYLVPSLLMVVCIVTVRQFGLGADGALVLGWLGGAIAVMQYPLREAFNG